MRKLLFVLIGLVLVIVTNSASTWAANMAVPTITPTLVPTVEYSLPFPGLLPDHPIYLLKTARDKFLEFLTKDPVKKIHLNLLLSDKRLVMGRQLWDKGEFDLSISTFSKGEKYLLRASQILVDLKQHQDLPPGLADKLSLASQKHEEIIEKIIDNANDEKKINDLKSILSVTRQTNQQILSVK